MSATLQPAAPANEFQEKPTLSQRFADAVTRTVGSTKFMLGQAIFIGVWIGLNVTNVLPVPHWDPNLTLLNLGLSTEAAYATSFILMSQNRQAERDRQTVQNDYKVDLEAREALKELNRKLDTMLTVLTPEQRKAFEDSQPKEPVNDNKAEEPKEQKASLSHRFADAVTKGMGSWKFIIGQAVFQTLWIGLNLTSIAPIPHWDPNLTLLNLGLSTQSAFAGSIILMSQARQAEWDRQTLLSDYQVDIETVRHIKEVTRKIDAVLTVLTPEQLKSIADANAAKEAANKAAEAAPVAKPVAKAVPSP